MIGYFCNSFHFNIYIYGYGSDFEGIVNRSGA
ncbi:MAG: hypothetical protein RLY46_660 [Bacteroidota bacterium]|jgi:hypothetical protein